MGRRWLLCTCSTFLPVLAPCLALYLKFGRAEWQRSLLFLLGIFAVSAFLNYVAWIKPVRDVEPAFNTALNLIGENLRIAAKRSDRLKVRINVMLLCHPLKKVFQQHLRIVWAVGMDNQPDINASFSITKGVAGEAFRTKTCKFVDFTQAQHADFGFTDNEIRRYGFERIKAILSFPVYALDSKNRQTGKIIGVVNLDTTDRDGVHVLRNRMDKYIRLLEGIGNCVSKVASK